MRSLLLLVAVAAASALNLPKISDPCDRVECRAGRECIVSGGVAQCLCVTRCPDHDKPVCGSDGESYDNYCLLHQRACLTGEHISVGHRGYCQNDIDMALRAFGITTQSPTTSTPSTTITTSTTTTASTISTTPVEDDLSVCYGPQRDALRNTIIEHWQETVKKQPWYTDNMTYKESLSGHFFSCDKNRDYRLRPDELIDCFSTMPFLPRPEQDLTITRTLCTDALIETADNNRDWRLDFQEFTHLLDPLYHLQAKNCSLEGRQYTDGAEVRVECNHCVCATGSWVCATHNCPPSTTTQKPTTVTKDSTFGYMDTKYDLENKDDLDDDEYYDDYEDDEEYEDDYIEEEAKKEYKLLSSSEKKKLTHLESNIKHFYNDVKKWDDADKTNNIKDKDSKKKATKVEETSSEEEEEEEDDLLDQYDILLEKSEKVKEKLTSLKNAIHTLEERRRIHRANRQHRRKDGLDGRHFLSNGVHINEVHSNDDHHSSGRIVGRINNGVSHSSIRPGKIHAANKKQQKHEAYRAAMRAKLERHRLLSQTDNDIWEDQWKAEIKKHHHDEINNNHL